MKYSFDISNFLEVIAGLFHSIAFLYFFALFSKECLLISPCYSLELCIRLGISFPFSLAFYFSLSLSLFFFNLLFVKPPQTTTWTSCIFFFGMGLVTESCTMLQTSVHCSIGILSTRSNPLNLFITSAV